MILAAAGCGGHGSSMKPFVGTWYGHTRALTVKADGTGAEAISDGCCQRVVALRFKVEAVRGGVARIRLTWVRNYGSETKLKTGERGMLSRHDGVFTDSLTHSTYCVEGVSACGA